ncbi:IS110 family transposase [Arthrobacter sp. STN4]|uniref:IS110 family transposase n=1 Tax=Arthrobacter sp. STN4 TaxID=2923276 RepID=UPI00211A533C|nr:IS110 family transposase [Arthrobacter sp. STN4]MCQ9166185.1 IS110 family transposase [Arthrobacter sp. STN4]
MTLVTEKYDYVIGIDTHARTHTYAAINTRTGAQEGCEAFPVSPAGMRRAIAWIGRSSTGEVLAAVEGTRSYGSSITAMLTAKSIPVVEAKPPKRQARAGVGKTDEIDATAAAMGVLGKDTAALMYPRAEGVRAAISVLLASRRRVDHQRTVDRNALNALVREINLGLETRKALTDRQLIDISAWRQRTDDTAEQRIARDEAVRLASSVLRADKQLKRNKEQLAELGEELAPGLQNQTGVGPVTAGAILVAYSHHGRIRSEAAFAALAGAAPLQASSGNTVRHRLNRHGDRQLNSALDVIAKTRMRCDEQTKQYVERRTAQGLSYREIKRILKRYIARSIYRQLQHLTA